MNQEARKLNEAGNTLKPFLKWAGGKRQLLSELLRRVPEFNEYHEPFLGGGAMFFALNPKKAYLSDINPDLINAYTAVRDEPQALIQDLLKHVYEKEYFYKVRSADRESGFSEWSKVEKASRMIFLNKTAFNGLYRLNSRGQFNVPFGRYKNPRILNKPLLESCSEALANAELTVQGFKQSLQLPQNGDFVYLDPPYIPVSETSNFTGYSQEGFSIQDQQELAQTCKVLDKHGIKFMLSNSYGPMIEELYGDFKIETITARRSINSNSQKRGKIPEVIVTNY